MCYSGKVHPAKRSRHQQENHVRQIKVGREAKNFKLFMEGAKTKKLLIFYSCDSASSKLSREHTFAKLSVHLGSQNRTL